MEPYINLLLDNHNLVLTGAPGTGKTYLAKQIASQFILGKEYNDLLSESEMKQFNEQCTFVQFHPSYDYTDFVEGLKPIYKANCNDIGFERKDGIFKSFCHAAIDNKFTYSVHSNNDESSKKIRIRPLKELNLNILYNHFYNLGVKDISDLNGEDFLKIIRDSNRTETKTLDYQYYQAVIQELLNTENDQNSSFETKYKYLKDKIEKQGTISLSINKRTYIAEITSTKLIGIQSSSNCEIYDNSNLEESNEEEKKFVFIIDEINRGEISKIIGELFFSIDPGYRGPEGTVKTQYQNLISDIKDPFYEGFYVPTNVYIIGTMNDIDRSVESMDFAMRRRFAWKEISANDRKDMWNGNIDKWKAEAENRMDSLNAKIESIPAFNKSYHIGPAYFLKLKYYDGKFELLWKYHIKGLLAEYLRGMTEAEELLGKLEKAYKDYDLLKSAVMNTDGNDDADTAPTFKVLEEGASTLSKEEAGQLAQRQMKFIQHLRAALVRIENKTYGICRETGKLIPKERLKAVPHATLSIDAKQMKK